MEDFTKIPAGTPVWQGNWPPAGHGGTYNEVNGGKYGIAASNWLKWILLGDQEAAKWFKNDDLPKSDGWTNIQKKGLENVPSL
jgi:hypothetical protein